MTVLETARFLLKKYTSGGDPHPTRDEHNLMIDAIENNAVMGSQGVTGARPAAGKGRRLFWDETAQRLQYDDGANWKDLNPNGGGGAGTVIVPGAAAVEGTSVRAARADHTHALPLATNTAHGAMSSADKTKLDAATAAATPSTLAARDASGRISVGTPINADHAATKAYTDDILNQAADYTDAKVAAGVSPTVLAPLGFTGYVTSGRVIVERKGAYNRITVAVNVVKTGADDTIPSTVPFKTLGVILPAAARGAGAVDHYQPVSISGGATNTHATVFLDPDTGMLQIRSQTQFTIQNGATFTLKADYLVDAP